MKYELVQDYARRVREQCQFIIMAHADMRAAVEKGDAAQSARKHVNDRDRWKASQRAKEDADRDLRYALQAFVIAVANVHKALWLVPGAEAAREPVRKALGVIEESAGMRTARQIRGYHEHWDKNLNLYRKHKPTLMVEGTTSSPLKIVGHEGERTVWRHYSPATETISFWDASVRVIPIVRDAYHLITAAEDVLNRCPQCMDEGREHPVTFQVERGYPAGYDLPALLEEDADT